MDCCKISTIKKILHVLNISLSIFSIIIIFACFSFLFQNSWKYFDKIIVYLILSTCLLIYSCFGLNGSIKEHHWMLTTYEILSLIMVVILVANGIIIAFTIINPSILEIFAYKEVTIIYNNYNNSLESKLELDNIQSKFHCCGVEGPYDFNSKILPKSCCYFYYNNNCSPDLPTVFMQGCAAALFLVSHTLLKIYLAIICVISGLMIIGNIASRSLQKSLLNHQTCVMYIT